MHYEAFQPTAELAPFVRSLYYFKGDEGAPGVHYRYQFPSDGGPEMIVNLGDPFAAGSSESRLQTFNGCHIIGPLTSHLSTRTSGLTAFVAVRFRPGGIAPFCDLPAEELTDRSADIGFFWGAAGRQLKRRVHASSSPAGAIAWVQRALSAKKNHRFLPDRRIQRAVATIMAHRGCLQVGALARSAALSRRQFERRFKHATGLSPKRLCRIARFAHLSSRISGNRVHEWSRTALECGYSDQAHMIRECRFFTGHSPQAYLVRRSPLETAIYS